MPGRLIILHQGAIGDFVLTLSVVQSVRAYLRADHVTAIASAPSARLAAGRSAVDEWRSPDSMGLHSLFRDDGVLDDRLLAVLRSADAIINFLSDSASPIHRRLVERSHKRVISVDPRPSSETLAARHHITDQWAAAIRSAGLPIGDPTPPVIRIESDRSADSPGRPRRAIIHPGSGSRGKCWPMERFLQLADTLGNLHISWLLGPAETESNELVRTLAQRTATESESLIISDDLVQAANLIAGADRYIGNDAGMTHVAAALGVPTVAIFCPTDPHVWLPLGKHVKVVATDHPDESMITITVDRVIKALADRSS